MSNKLFSLQVLTVEYQMPFSSAATNNKHHTLNELQHQ